MTSCFRVTRRRDPGRPVTPRLRIRAGHRGAGPGEAAPIGAGLWLGSTTARGEGGPTGGSVQARAHQASCGCLPHAGSLPVPAALSATPKSPVLSFLPASRFLPTSPPRVVRSGSQVTWRRGRGLLRAQEVPLAAAANVSERRWRQE